MRCETPCLTLKALDELKWLEPRGLARGADGWLCWPQIPYTFVRANSDYTHLPLTTDGFGNWVEQTNVPAVNFETGELSKP